MPKTFYVTKKILKKRLGSEWESLLKLRHSQPRSAEVRERLIHFIKGVIDEQRAPETSKTNIRVAQKEGSSSQGKNRNFEKTRTSQKDCSETLQKILVSRPTLSNQPTTGTSGKSDHSCAEGKTCKTATDERIGTSSFHRDEINGETEVLCKKALKASGRFIRKDEGVIFVKFEKNDEPAYEMLDLNNIGNDTDNGLVWVQWTNSKKVVQVRESQIIRNLSKRKHKKPNFFVSGPDGTKNQSGKRSKTDSEEKGDGQPIKPKKKRQKGPENKDKPSMKSQKDTDASFATSSGSPAYDSTSSGDLFSSPDSMFSSSTGGAISYQTHNTWGSDDTSSSCNQHEESHKGITLDEASTDTAVQKREESKENNPPNTTKFPPKPPNDDIESEGYVFRKYFENHGWFDGQVVKIRPGAMNGQNRLCVYSDNDKEDLSLDDLKELAKLDPNNKNFKEK